MTIHPIKCRIVLFLMVTRGLFLSSFSSSCSKQLTSDSESVGSAADSSGSRFLTGYPIFDSTSDEINAERELSAFNVGALEMKAIDMLSGRNDACDRWDVLSSLGDSSESHIRGIYAIDPSSNRFACNTKGVKNVPRRAKLWIYPNQSLYMTTPTPFSFVVHKAYKVEVESNPKCPQYKEFYYFEGTPRRPFQELFPETYYCGDNNVTRSKPCVQSVDLVPRESVTSHPLREARLNEACLNEAHTEFFKVFEREEKFRAKFLPKGLDSDVHYDRLDLTYQDRPREHVFVTYQRQLAQKSIDLIINWDNTSDRPLSGGFHMNATPQHISCGINFSRVAPGLPLSDVHFPVDFAATVEICKAWLINVFVSPSCQPEAYQRFGAPVYKIVLRKAENADQYELVRSKVFTLYEYFSEYNEYPN